MWKGIPNVLTLLETSMHTSLWRVILELEKIKSLWIFFAYSCLQISLTFPNADFQNSISDVNFTFLLHIIACI